jgi:hypothetical protein
MIPFGSNFLLWVANLFLDNKGGTLDHIFSIVSYFMGIAPISTLYGLFWLS